MKIRVPGTTANIGPGFDALGMALTCYSTLTLEEDPKVEPDSENLILRAFQYFYEKEGRKPPRVNLTLEGAIPPSRGLGSSAACIVGGLIAANEYSGLRRPKETLLKLATEIEGHPDNVAPCLLGGLVCATEEGDRVLTAKFDVSKDWNMYVAIPDFPLSTSVAREALPKTLSFQEGVFNVSKVPLLLKGLESGDLDLLRAGAKDVFAEPYRGPLIDEYEKIKEFGNKHGVAVISGAGPSVLLISLEEDLEEEFASYKGDLKNQWELHKFETDREGAKVL